MAPSATLDDFQPRPEARPLAWKTLTKDQQHAAKRGCKLLRAIAKRPWKATEPPTGLGLFLPPIDEERVNHVVLLDGNRGSGKTALLVTILDALSRNLQDDDSHSNANARYRPLQKALNLRGQVIVPVGLVDLQPLPRSTNLLLYIVGRFQRVVEAIEQATGHEGARAPWNAVGDDEPKCTKRWRDFLRGAAIGWDGNLSGRRANLDPEAYALEVDQAERQRLDMVTSFRRFVDALVEDWSKLRPRSKGKPPLFVLSIDDADMNPVRSVELLDLVRALWHPRVAFLLTGDSALFMEALRGHVLGALREPLKGLEGITSDLRRSFDRRMPDRLSREIYDKVIPEEHRLSLPLLNEDARYAFVKEVLDIQVEGAHSHARVSTIKQLFDNYKQLRAALPGRLRHLLSFQSWLRSMLGSGRQEGAPEALLLERLWKTASDDPELPHPLAERLKRWMVWDNGGVRLRVEGSPTLTLGPATTRSHSERNGGGRVHVGGDFRIKIALDDKEILPDGVVGVILAIFDLGRSAKIDVENIPELTIIVQEFCSVDAYAFGSTFRVGWTLPPWQEFHSYMKMSEKWTSEVHSFAGFNEVDMVQLAKLYVTSILSQFDGGNADTAISWESLAHKVGELAIASPQSSGRDPALAAWARSLACLLAAPEGGLPADAANTWLEEFRAVAEKNGVWVDIKKELVDFRRRNIRRASGLPEGVGDSAKDLEAVIRELDQRSPAHAWRAVVEADPERLLGRLYARMKDIRVSSSRSSALADYVATQRYEELGKAPSAILDQLQASIRGFAKQSGQLGALAIERLWKVATIGRSSEVKQLISMADPGSLRLANEAAFRYLGKPYLVRDNFSTLFDSASRETLGLSVACASIGWTNTASDPWLCALYKMAMDLEADRSQAARGVLSPWWTVAGGKRSIEYPPIPWPAAAWPALIDWERIIDAWNLQIVPAVRKGGEEARIANSDIDSFGDAAAYWFVRATMHVAGHRCTLEDVQFEAGFPSLRWTQILSSQEEEIKHQWGPKRDAHRRAFFEWFQSIGLFAAPESGLTVGAARAILEGISELPQKREHLMTLRRERLKQPGVDDAAIDRMLATINEQFPNHPWVERVEKNYAASQQST